MLTLYVEQLPASYVSWFIRHLAQASITNTQNSSGAYLHLWANNWWRSEYTETSWSCAFHPKLMTSLVSQLRVRLCRSTRRSSFGNCWFSMPYITGNTKYYVRGTPTASHVEWLAVRNLTTEASVHFCCHSTRYKSIKAVAHARKLQNYQCSLCFIADFCFWGDL